MKEYSDNKLSHSHLSRWTTPTASLVFSFSAYVMLYLYGIVHWKIMFLGGDPPGDKFKEHVFTVLGLLMCLRIIFAVLAIIYPGLSFIQGPKSLAVLASIFAFLAAMTFLIMM